MAVTEDKPTPYAPSSAILDFITKYRDHGLSEPFDDAVLSKIGIPESLISRTLQALQTLDLITDDRRATETLKSFGLAKTDEYQDHLADWVKTVYADIFRFTDPSSGDTTAIRDAFRTYTPRGQQHRMVSLFINLCKEAGIITSVMPMPRTPKALKGKTKAAQKKRQRPPPAHSNPDLDGMPLAISGLLSELPNKAKTWGEDERDAFIAMLKSLLDYYYPAQPQHSQANQEGEL